jgi:hypothetical protein
VTHVFGGSTRLDRLSVFDSLIVDRGWLTIYFSSDVPVLIPTGTWYQVPVLCTAVPVPGTSTGVPM